MRHVLLPALASMLLLAGVAEGGPARAADAPPGASSCTGCHAAGKIPDSVIPRIAGRKSADIATAHVAGSIATVQTPGAPPQPTQFIRLDGRWLTTIPLPPPG